MRSDGRSRSTLARVALFGLIAVIVGVLAGHVVWSATRTLRLRPAGGGVGHLGYAGAHGSGAGANERGAPFGPGAFFEATQGDGSTENVGSREGGGVSSAVTAKVDPALVDIDTYLGLEGDAAAGTGMVVTSTGEVITNNHVITGATTITATDLGNGKTYKAHVVGYDHNQDIAVIQLEGASDLDTLSFGSAGAPQVGESIATIGNAGGVGGTPSAASGQVAALDQSITAGSELDGSKEQLSGLIEIEGGLEPGDSGGPLVNGAGEVLGMDTAASSSFEFESSADQGFAIPIERVLSVAKQILEGQSSSELHIGATGLLGVFVKSESESESEGALVENVIPGTPAASSGLSAGDTITSIDGASVTSPTGLTEAILATHPGEAVKVDWRTASGTEQSATVTLAAGPPQ